jgi:hypothetical protein
MVIMGCSFSRAGRSFLPIGLRMGCVFPKGFVPLCAPLMLPGALGLLICRGRGGGTIHPGPRPEA